MKSSETSPAMWRDQVGQEDEGALEHRDDVQAVGIVAADLAPPARRRASESASAESRISVGRSSAIGRRIIPAMKRFDIITEADARVLARGETVMLARARPHHAARARHAARAPHHRRPRRTASRRRRGAGAAGRHPAASRSPATTPASRCGARSSASCAAAGWRCTISAPTAPSRSTIPTSRRRSRAPVARGEADAGIVIDGAGIGSAIAANKIARHPRGRWRRRRRSRATPASTTAPTC